MPNEPLEARLIRLAEAAIVAEEMNATEAGWGGTERRDRFDEACTPEVILAAMDIVAAGRKRREAVGTRVRDCEELKHGVITRGEWVSRSNTRVKAIDAAEREEDAAYAAFDALGKTA